MIWHKAFFTKKGLLILSIAGLILSSPNCSTLFLSPEKSEIKEHLKEAEEFLSQRKFGRATEKYELINARYPENPWGDEVLFNLSCLYVYYDNPLKDFNKAKIHLERIIEEYHESSLRKETVALLAILNALLSKQEDIDRIVLQIAAKEKEIDSLRQRIKSLQIDQFTTFISTAYELSLRKQEIEELNKKMLNQKNAIDLLQTQMKKIKEVDIQHEKKKSDEKK
jgi:hypothetical protein